MRKRSNGNALKQDHKIISGFLPFLQEIAALPAVKSVIPGVINRRTGTRRGVTVQRDTETGFRCLIKSPRAIQEVYIVIDDHDRANVRQQIEEMARKRF